MENDDQTHAQRRQAVKDLVAEKPKEYSVLFYALRKEIFSKHSRELKDMMGLLKELGSSKGLQGTSNENDSEENN
ncbi:hypothetical protein TELCIR_12431 [Teladorsagia circumcincta]|uniref:SXP/RAL-2 family protein Ani s 5-like cation-binding domain-containing protein n=1 Tax=Teladorsagia circumcincta TaxID=45464 RepID=A0A2G9U6S7_TELCI|nr:hypothetical protein TELCIR_12431 [Teladorsagia circumcincta]